MSGGAERIWGALRGEGSYLFQDLFHCGRCKVNTKVCHANGSVPDNTMDASMEKQL